MSSDWSMDINNNLSLVQVSMIMVGNMELARSKLEEGWSGVFPGADITWIINAAKQFSDIMK